MRALKVAAVSLLLLNLCASASENSKKKTGTDDMFVPTHQWQVVRKDQVLPRGLEVRINLETGLIEAKLPTDSRGKGADRSSSLVALPTGDDAPPVAADQRVLSESRLKEALKNIKNEGSDEEGGSARNEEKKKKVKEKFRSYEDLKKDLGDLNLTPKTDSEILADLLEQHARVSPIKDATIIGHDEKHVLTILEDLDYLVHQYDNANEFVRLGGFRHVILVDMNSTSELVRLGAMKLLGSSVQNNALVQIHALENNCVSILLRVLALESSPNAKSRAIFALGSLLRRFPLAQLKFLENAGLAVFADLLGSSSSLQIRLKVATLVNDLIVEQREAAATSFSSDSDVSGNSSSSSSAKLKQYNQVDMRRRLDTFAWCDKLHDLLVNVLRSDAEDHDGTEKCLAALESVMDSCAVGVAHKLRETVADLNSRYKKLARNGEPTDSDYFSQMAQMCARIYNYFTDKYKTEL